MWYRGGKGGEGEDERRLEQEETRRKGRGESGRKRAYEAEETEAGRGLKRETD